MGTRKTAKSGHQHSEQFNLGLQGHVALVTGANHGIGAATALILASHGAAVVVSYLRIPDPGESAGVGEPIPFLRRRRSDSDISRFVSPRKR